MRTLTQDRISHIVIMGNLHLVEQDRILQLGGIAHDSSFSHDHFSADKGTLTYFSVFSDDGRPYDLRAFFD